MRARQIPGARWPRRAPPRSRRSRIGTASLVARASAASASASRTSIAGRDVRRRDAVERRQRRVVEQRIEAAAASTVGTLLMPCPRARRSFEGVDEQHRARHRPDASGTGVSSRRPRKRATTSPQSLPSGPRVHADVDHHHRAALDHRRSVFCGACRLRRRRCRPGASARPRSGRRAVADRDRRVGVQHHRHRLSPIDVAAPDHDHALPRGSQPIASSIFMQP